MKREELAWQFDLLARLLRIVRDNPFKARSYEFAAKLAKSKLPSRELTEEDLEEFFNTRGIGKAIREKSLQFLHEGRVSKIEELEAAMPEAIYTLAVHSRIDPQVLAYLWKDAGLTQSEAVLDFLVKQKSELKLTAQEIAQLTSLLQN